MANPPLSAGSGVMRHRALPYLALAGGVFATSFASIMTKAAQAPPTVIAFWRLFLTALLLTPPLLLRHRAALAGVGIRDWALTALSGGALAVHFYCWNTSLVLTSVAASTILVDMHPFLVITAGYFFFGERVGPMGSIGAVLAVAGAIAIGAADATGGGHTALLGDVYALLGAVAVGGYFVIGRAVRQRVELLPYTVAVYVVSSMLLLAAALVAHLPVVAYPTRTWELFAGLALLPTIFGHTVFSWVLRYVRAGLVSLAVLGEPVGAGVLAWLVYNQRPGLQTYLGAALILVGIAIFVTNVGDAR